MQHPIVIQYENGDEIIHTDEHPYCFDLSCPCSEALMEEALAEISAIEVEKGLISRIETRRFRLYHLRQWWNAKTDPDMPRM